MRISSGAAASRRAFFVAVCAATGLGACSSGSTFPGPSWNLTGGKDTAQPKPIAPLDARETSRPPDPTKPAATYRGGRDPVTGRAPPWGGTSQAVALPPAQLAPVGQSLPPPQAAAPAHAPAPRASQVEVKPGQSLSTIAAEQRVSIAALMTANRLRDPYVIPGQVLIVPRP